jgi:glycosyltransferase involved in cell wall biosynthesis
MNNPLISIITVVYNGVATLEQTILSVINQTYKNIEYIIIDGDSTDGTIDIIKKYEKHLAYWISEPDKGIYYAMNKGIEKTTGEWINFMNSGDLFYNVNVINEITKYLQNDIDVICGRICGEKMNKRKINGYFFFRHISICHQAIFARRNLLYDGFDTRYQIAGDTNWLQKIYFEGFKFKSVNIIIALYEGGGISETNLKQVQRETYEILKKYFPWIIATFRMLIYYIIIFYIKKHIKSDFLKKSLIFEFFE